MAGIAAIIPRREVQSERVHLPPNRVNFRFLERFGLHDAPDPIRQTNFAAMGKPASHAQSRQQIALTCDRESLTHQRDGFVEPLNTPANLAGMPRGKQASYSSRVNVARNPAGAYGSIVLLQAGY